ncbi:MAG: hypothetical protein K8L99_11860 [Anaerolineae bacterium]|nr:hypothetical protein [Anaerolineae bacterium]
MRLKIFLSLFLLLIGMSPAAAQAEYSIYATAQRFDGGQMIWRSDNGTIYVLANSGQALTFPALAYRDLPDNPIFGTPPSRLRPIFGFGKVWGNHQSVRDLLGWPIRQEIGYNLGVRSTGGSTFLRQLDGIVLEVRSNGSWQYVNDNPPDYPTILNFSVTPQQVPAGERVNVSWSITGTEIALLEMYDGDTTSGTPLLLLENLPTTGNTVVNMPLQSAGVVRLVIWGANRYHGYVPVTMYERVVSDSRLVQITSAQFGEVITYAAYQRYDRGFMLWRQDEGTVLVFADGGAVYTFLQAFYGGMADNPVPVPDGVIAPRNAFGKVWGNFPYVREAVGYPVIQEQGYTLNVTHYPESSMYTLPNNSPILVGQTWRPAT